MSRVYFHSPSGTAELAGSERRWLDHLATTSAKSLWDLNNHFAFNQAVRITELIPEVPEGQYGANYLHRYMREALNAPSRDSALERRFVEALQTKLGMGDVKLVIADVTLHSGDLELNTALATGSDPVKLAAKIHGWCEVHAWVDGPDRDWMANIMQQGLDAGLYRRGLWRDPLPFEKTTERTWTSQGWEEVIEFLRQRDDEPVVMSFSVCEQFPHADIADWMPDWPEGVERSWDALTEQQQQERQRLHEDWYDLPGEEQWQRGMAGLRRRRPWAQITPGNLGVTTFGPAVTVLDVLAADREDRVRAAVGEAQKV